MLDRSSVPIFSGADQSNAKITSQLKWVVLLVGLGVGFVTAYLVVAGNWHLALPLIFALPGFLLLHRHPFLSILIWFILSPFLLHTTTGAERQVYWIIHRTLPPLTLGIIWLSSALKIRQRPLPSLGFPELLMAGYLAFGLLSILLQNSMPQATLYLFYDRVFSPMCLYIILRLTNPGEKEWKWLLPVLFLIVVSQTTVGMISWVAPSVLPSKWLDKVGQRTTGTLVNPSIYTTALIFAGLLLLHGALQMKQGWFRKVLTFVFVLCVFGIVISLSRASWIAGIVVILGLVYLYPKFMLRFSLVVVVLSLLLGSVILPIYIDNIRQRLFSEQAEGSALDRLPGYLAAYRMFQEKPLFGWGYGNFDVYDRQFMGRVLDFANDNKDHASHNWFLSTIAEQGLVGMGLFFGPFIYWLFMSVRRWPQISKGGVWSRKFLILLWLIVLTEVIINMFMNMIIFFGHGIWWVVLGFIAVLLAEKRVPDNAVELEQKAAAVWQAAPFKPY